MKQKLALGSCLIALILASTQANAANVAAQPMPTGTLNISGNILDKGCTFETKDAVIQLPPVVSTDFTASGDMGPKSDPVNFNLTGCPANSTFALTVLGTAGSMVYAFATATGTDKATGFDLILYSGSTIVRPNNAITLTSDGSGNYSGTLSAVLRSKVAAPTSGKIDTTLTYTLAYN